MKLRTIFLFALLLSIVVIANAQVVINEIYYDSPGTDTHVFTELKGTPGTNLSGYWLVGVNGNYTSPTTYYDSVALVGTIPASGYFVVAQDTGVANYNQIAGIHCDWQNAGSPAGNGDNLILRNGSQIIDAVGYGNFDGADSLAIWAGEPANTRPRHPAPDAAPTGSPQVGYSISRIPDGQDANDNQADFQTTLPTPGAANAGSNPTPIVRTILQLRTNRANGVPNDSGSYIVTHGIVNVASSIFTNFSNISYSVQDRQQAGVWIYGSSGISVNAGDSVTIQGYVITYRGQTEITSPYLFVTNHGAPQVPLAAPIDVTTGDLASAANGEQYEGLLIRVTSATIGSGNWPVQDSSGSVQINDGSGSVTMNIFKGTDLDGWTNHPTQGTVVPWIIGIGNQYAAATPPFSGGYEFQPRSQADFAPLGVNDHDFAPIIEKFELRSTYPNPFNHTTKIRYTVSNGEVANLAIFDVNGRQIATLGKNIQAGNRMAFWNGRNNAGQSVAGGMYFVRLSGRTHSSTLKTVYLP